MARGAGVGGGGDPFAHVARGTGRGPGWARGSQRRLSGGARHGAGHRGPSQRVSVGLKGRSDVAVGAKVFHSKFGSGTVIAVDGNKLEIDFEHAGQKRVLDSFVEVVG